MRRAVAVIWLSVLSCGKHDGGSDGSSSPDYPEPEDLQAFMPEMAALASDLSVTFTTKGDDAEFASGWVGPVRGGRVVAEGDSLYWQGHALAVLPCELLEAPIAALEASGARRNGALVRYEPLPPKFIGDEVSRDGVTAIMTGLFSVVRRCPAYAERARQVWAHLVGYVHRYGKGVTLYLGSNAWITKPFNFYFDLESHDLIGHASPSVEAEGMAEIGNQIDADRIRSHQEACYPINLSTLSQWLAWQQGRPASRDGRAAFCRATAGTDMVLTDWFCGRAKASDLLKQDWSVWMYRHQRCGGWELPDLKPDERSPRLDRLILYCLAGRGNQGGFLCSGG